MRLSSDHLHEIPKLYGTKSKNRISYNRNHTVSMITLSQ